MSFWELLKDNLSKFEKVNKGKWFIYSKSILKFECIVFGMNGEVKAKFKRYDFMKSIEWIDYTYLDMNDMYMTAEVDNSYIEEQIKTYAMVKLIT